MLNKVKFKDVVKRCHTKEDRFNTDKVYYVGGEHIQPNELKVLERGIIQGSTIGPMFYFGFKAGQILFVTRNPHLHKAALADFDGICSEKTLVLETADSSILLQEYLELIMQSDAFWQYCEIHKSGSINYFINWSTLANFEFNLPSIEEQKSIADKVWAAYELKEAYKKMIAATDEMVKAQFIEMFGGCTHQKELATLCDVFIDGDWIETKDQSNEGIRLVQTGNVGQGYFKDKDDKSRYISDETFKRLNCTEIKAGDILVSRLPDPIGRACIVPDNIGKAITAVDCSIIRLNAHILPEFFIVYTQTVLYTVQINKVVTGTTRLRISRNNLGKILVPVPDMASQSKFSEIVHQAEKSKSELRQAIEKIDRVMKSLMQ